MEKAVLLFTGGCESLYNLHRMLGKFSLTLLYFDYGQEAYQQERRSVEYYAKLYSLPVKFQSVPLSVPPIRDGENIRNPEVHGRNLIFVALAVNYAKSIGANIVVLGTAQLGKSWFDGGNLFREALSEIIKKSYGVKLMAPSEVPLPMLLRKLTKVDHSYLRFCPRQDSEKNCGECEKCVAIKTFIQRDRKLDPLNKVFR